MDREQNLTRVRDRTKSWDIIVIGGGATGVGCAVDAASRGYDVLLVEQHDFGKGTSSRSTKLIHGGVRYLAQGNLSLVREALRERGILLRNAPHVVHKQAFIVPCYSPWQVLYYGTGLKIYDLLSGKNSFGRSRFLSRNDTADKLPGIIKKGLVGGVLYFDGQFDDTRLLIDLVKTGIDQGATILNYARVTSLAKNSDGNIQTVEFDDALTGETFMADAKVVINATGAFCDAVRELAESGSKPLVTLSQGIHLVFDRKFFPSKNALMIPRTSDGRVLFCIPWHGHTLVGTTDTPISDAGLEPHALDAEIDFILDSIGKYLSEKPMRGDVLSAFAGIRPLVRSNANRKTSSLSRSHTIDINDAGLLTVTGGKWTTYRQMAEDAIDQAVKLAGLEPQISVTATLSINPQPETPAESSLLHSDLPYTEGDVAAAVQNEMARTVEDVLARRTRALFLNARAAVEIAPNVADLIAPLLGKDSAWKASQIEEFKKVAYNYLLR